MFYYPKYILTAKPKLIKHYGTWRTFIIFNTVKCGLCFGIFQPKSYLGQKTLLCQNIFSLGILNSYQRLNNPGQNMNSENNMKKENSTSRCWERKISPKFSCCSIVYKQLNIHWTRQGEREMIQESNSDYVLLLLRITDCCPYYDEATSPLKSSWVSHDMEYEHSFRTQISHVKKCFSLSCNIVLATQTFSKIAVHI